MRFKCKGQVGILLGLMVWGVGCAAMRNNESPSSVNSTTSGQGSVIRNHTPTNVDYGDGSNTQPGQAPGGFSSSTIGQSSSGSDTPVNGTPTREQMNQ